MVVEIRFRTEAYFTTTAELSDSQLKAFEKNLGNGIGGNEAKANGFINFLTRDCELDHIAFDIDLEEVTIEKLGLPYNQATHLKIIEYHE